MDLTADKGVSLVIFFLVTVVAGSLPVTLFTQCRGRMSSRKARAVISLVNCFAGGVFLGTCLLFLLTEGLEEYEDFKQESGFASGYPFFHLGIGAGFFAVAFVERVAIVVSKRSFRKQRKQHSVDCEDGIRVVDVKLTNGEVVEMASVSPSAPKAENVAVFTVSDPSSAAGPANTSDSNHHNHHYHCNNDSSIKATSDKSSNTVACYHLHSHCSLGTEEEEEGTERFTGHSGVKAVTIFLALSFHTIFDGLTVGLQESQSDVWTTTIAISIHKTIVALSLGMELAAASPDKVWRALVFLFIFALMAPLGVAIGMGVTSGKMDDSAHLLASGVLQALASGSFLHVIFFEVLGEELGHQASVVKILATMLGFSAMAVAKVWDND